MRIYNDEDTAKLYRLNRYVKGPKGGKGKEISSDYQKRLYCQTVSNDYDESQFCNDDDKFDLHHDNAVMTFINMVDNHWFTKKGKVLHKKAKSSN